MVLGLSGLGVPWHLDITWGDNGAVCSKGIAAAGEQTAAILYGQELLVGAQFLWHILQLPVFISKIGAMQCLARNP